MNAIFGFHVHLSIGDGVILAVGSGTAVFVEALPPPQPLQVGDRAWRKRAQGDDRQTPTRAQCACAAAG